jgi:hypothetical protein
MNDRYIVIDEEGYFAFDGRRVDDEALGRALLENLKVDSHGRLVTDYQGAESFVEAFDAPLLGRHVRLIDGETGEIDLVYQTKARFAFKNLSLDEWDRFHGITENGVPFVFTRQGQIEFFDLFDSFDDDSITIKGNVFEVPAWAPPELDPVDEESPILKDILPQLKLTRSRVLVLNARRADNAAAIARAGHFVTAVESDPALFEAAREKYGSLDNLRLVRADLTNLPDNWNGEFDVVFVEGFTPDKTMVKLWRRVLHANGTLLGVFPASEWAIRERLKSGFQALYWTRWRRSTDARKSRELVVYARKKS